jgi:NAD(P)-dependent dehydrogenase (short-subunit alcohol dehydrogenase family)
MSDVFGLEGVPALVVGGGSGIGRATANLLHQVGASVAVADLNADLAQEVASEVNGVAVSGDVTDRAGAAAVVDEARAALGGLGALVNIVGAASWSLLNELDDETWERDLRLNLTQHLYVCQAAAKHMTDGGAMSLVASVSGLYGAPNHAAYGAAKAGVMALARTMANEWGPKGIRINCVAPDIIATPRVVAGFAESGVGEMNDIARADGVPLGRWGRPEEIAGPLVFLVSPLAGFMTGQTLVVDGGTQARFPHGGANPLND